MTTQACSHTFTYHTDKVQSITWHPEDGWVLATGSFDKSICLLDCRNKEHINMNSSNIYITAEDIESLTWNIHDTNQLYVALENGTVRLH